MTRRELPAALALAAASPPRELARLADLPRILLLPDLTYQGYYVRRAGRTQEVAVIRSRDGSEWSAPETALALPSGKGGWLYTEALLARDGRLHLFLLNDRGTGVVETGEGERPRVGSIADRRLDVWHTASNPDRTAFAAPTRIWEGYTGALNSVVQLGSGRILLPFSYRTPRTWRQRGTGLDAFTFRGQFNSTVVWSDDGDQWRQADAHLKTPTPDIVSSYGAVEPVAVELRDGRAWMLIRTQMGRFWESFSRDGIAWSAPAPTSILSSDSPAGLVRLPDGRIVLLWNNCLRHPYAHGGRHVLHAAISEDDGRTWRGYREVARDPLRADPPPPSGDHGTAYPYPLLGRGGKVVFSTGQGHGRRLVVELDPAWLYETAQTEDFARGLEAWSVFATRGVEADGRSLRIARVDPDWPAVAVWNFPNAASGRLTLRVSVDAAPLDAQLMLTDHYSTPMDEEDRFHCLYLWRLTGPARELVFEWSAPRRECRVSRDGRRVAVLPLLRESPGANYLRLRAVSGGFRVHRVEMRA